MEVHGREMGKWMDLWRHLIFGNSVGVPDTAAVPLFEAERPSPGTEKSGFFLAIRIS